MSKELKEICFDIFWDLMEPGNTTIQTTRQGNIITFLIKRTSEEGNYTVERSLDQETLGNKTNRTKHSLVTDFWDSMRF